MKLKGGVYSIILALLIFGVILGALVFLPSLHKAKAADPVIYYIDNAGSDANNGTSDSTPWQTIDKVNDSTFNPGDQILFKKGGVWRETLTVPSSGDSSNRIVFSSYGIGDRPEINASQQILNSDFSLSSTVPSVVYSNTLNVDSTTAGIRNYRMLCPVTTSSNTVKIRLNASTTLDWNITAVSISEQSSLVTATATPVQILWDSGSVSTTITAATSKDSDVLNFPVVAGHTYLVHIYMADKHYKGSSTLSYYYDSITASNESLLQTPTGSQLASGPLNGGPVSAILGDNVDIYKVASATDPLAVWEDGEFLAKKTSALTGVLGQWYWDGVDLYVCANNGGNIITGGKTYEKVNLLYTINDNSQSWLEFKNINCSRAGQSGATVVGVRNGGANNLWHDMEIYSNLGHAISIMQGSINCRVYNMDLHDSSSTTIVAIFGNQALNQTTGNYLEYSELYQTNPNCVSTPIVIHGKANGNYIQYNDIHLDVAYQTSLIMTYDDETSNTIRYNYLHYTGGRIFHAIYVYDGSAAGTDPANGGGPNYIYGNIIDMRGQTGILAQEGIYFWNALGSSEVYNNTILMTNASYAAIGATNSPNLTIKNNIVDAPFNMNIDANSQTGFVSDYNDFYYASGISLKWGATAYATLADWLTNSLQDAHSINADPKFVNSASDYNLQATSPGIDAGYDTSIATDYAGKVRYDDPSVANTGAGTLAYYDIGAYEYPYPVAIVPAAPTVNATSSSSLTVIINPNGNADWAEYAILNETANKYVKADGSMSDLTGVWQTVADWNATGYVINTGLTPNTAYTYKVKARNGDLTETALSTGTAQTTLATYILTYSAGANGSIVGTSPQTVDSGASGAQVTATPDTGYHFVSWSDNGLIVAARTDINVAADITVTATFAIDTYTITASADANGSIDPTGATSVDYDGSQAFILIPSSGYYISDIKIDGVSQVGVLSTPYSFTNVIADHTITVSFAVSATSGSRSKKKDETETSPTQTLTLNEIPTTEEIVTEITNTLYDYNAATLTAFFTTNLASDSDSLTVSFDASGSTSNKGIVNYTWDFGDGTTSNEIKVDHLYKSPGRYTVTLTVTDKSGNKNTTTQIVDVRPAPPTITNITAKGNLEVETQKTNIWQIVSVVAGLITVFLIVFLVLRRRRA